MSEAEGERDFVGVDFDAGSVVATSYSQLQRSLTRAGTGLGSSSKARA